MSQHEMDNYNNEHVVSNITDQVFQPEERIKDILLLKQKIYKTSNLIKRYSDAVKETNHLKLDLESIKKNSKHITSNYQSVMDKTRKLELNITEVKEENSKLQKKVEEYDVLSAADKQHIQQLKYTIKEMEDKHSGKILEYDLKNTSLEDKIKKLEQQLKMSRLEMKKKRNNITNGKTIDNNNITDNINKNSDESADNVKNVNDIIQQNIGTKSSVDIGINVSFDDIKLDQKITMQEKNTMTDEFYPLDKDPYPVFCATCRNHMYPPPIEQICQIMSTCPDLIEPIFSPRPISPLSPICGKELEQLDQNIPVKEYLHRNVPKKELEYSKQTKTASTSKVLSSLNLTNSHYNSPNNTQDFQVELKDSFATPQNVVNVGFDNEDHRNSTTMKNMEKAFKLWKRKSKKKMRNMKKEMKKINKKHSCHCDIMNSNNVAATNAVTSPHLDLFVNMCKTMMELHTSKEKVHPKNERLKKKQKSKSEKCERSTKKIKLKRLKKRREFSWNVEDVDRNISQDTICTNAENTSDINVNEANLSDGDFPVYINTNAKPVDGVMSVNKMRLTAETESVAVGKSVPEIESVAAMESVAAVESVVAFEPSVTVKSISVVDSVSPVKSDAEENFVEKMETVATTEFSKPLTTVNSVVAVNPITEVECVAKPKLSIEVESISAVDFVSPVNSDTEENFVQKMETVATTEFSKPLTTVNSVVAVNPITEVESISAVDSVSPVESDTEENFVEKIETVTTMEFSKPLTTVNPVVAVNPITEVECVAKPKSSTEVESISAVEFVSPVESDTEENFVEKMETVATTELSKPLTTVNPVVAVKPITKVECVAKPKSSIEVESISAIESVSPVKSDAEKNFVGKMESVATMEFSKPLTTMNPVVVVKPITKMECVVKPKSSIEVESVAIEKLHAEVKPVVEVKSDTGVESVATEKCVSKAMAVAKEEPHAKVKPDIKVKSIEKLEFFPGVEVGTLVIPVTDNSAVLHSNADKIHTNNSSNANNVEPVILNSPPSDSYIATRTRYYNNKNIINYYEDDIDDNIVITKDNFQGKKKGGRLLKRIRNLKRTLRTNLRTCPNKQLKVETCFNDDSECPAKKRRIAHTPKTFQSDFDKDFTDHTIEDSVKSIISSLPSNVKKPKDTTSTEIEKNCTTNEKHDGNNHVKFNPTRSLNKAPSLVKENPRLCNTKDSSPRNDGIINNTEQLSSSNSASSSINPDDDHASSNNINNETTSTDIITVKELSDCNESETPVLRDNLTTMTNNEESKEPASPNVVCQDSENVKLTKIKRENVAVAANNVTSHHMLRFIASSLKPTNNRYKRKSAVVNDTHNKVSENGNINNQNVKISQDSLSEEEDCAAGKELEDLNVTCHVTVQDDEIQEEAENLPSPPKKRNITRNHVSDNNVQESQEEINFETEERERCVESDGKSIKLEPDTRYNRIKENVRSACVSNDHNYNINYKTNVEENSDIKYDTVDNANKDDMEVSCNNGNNDEEETRKVAENRVNDNDVRESKDVISFETERREAFVKSDDRFTKLDLDTRFKRIGKNDCNKDNDNCKNNIKEIGDIKDGILSNCIEITSNNDNDDIEKDAKLLAPMDHLMTYINNNLKRGTRSLTGQEKAHRLKTLKVADLFARKQLTRLLQSDWQVAIHNDVVDKLCKTCAPRLIAKCILESLAQQNDKEKCAMDVSFTPPAPVMTRFEQIIVTLLVDLEQSKPGIIGYVMDGVQYKLFKLSNKLMFTDAETFTRIYVVLARLRNDRDAVRIMCCDALYCLGVRAINVLYVVLTSWPEIFPHANTYKGLLPKCIAFLISQFSTNSSYNKLMPLKMLISQCYQYTDQTTIEKVNQELMTALTDDDNQDGLSTAILLLAKRNGTYWTHENIIKASLKPMIVQRKYPCMYSAFSLLGKLLRSFPINSNDDIVEDISTSLSDLLKSGELEDEDEEGIASALLHLSRHEFDTAIKAVMKWTPRKVLRPNTIRQIDACIKLHTPKFWKRYVQMKKLFRIYSK